MQENELVIHFGEPIQPLERDPMPVNKAVFKNAREEFRDKFSWFETLELTVDFMSGMPPMTGEPKEVIRAKNDFFAIFIMKEVRRLAPGRETKLNQDPAEILETHH